MNYSKFVVILKIILPIFAVAILGVLFAASPSDDFGEPVKVSTSDLEQDIIYQIRGAQLRGVSEDGHRFDFTAESIDPDDNKDYAFSIKKLDGKILFYQKDSFYISALEAQINTNKSYLDLTGNLKIETESGLKGHTNKLRLVLTSNNLLDTGPIEIEMPHGIVKGGKLKILEMTEENVDGSYVFLENGVTINLNEKVLLWD